MYPWSHIEHEHRKVKRRRETEAARDLKHRPFSGMKNYETGAS
jgi:hypothetical protein